MEGKCTKSIWKGHEVGKHDRYGKHSMRESKHTNKRENKQESTQKVVSARDKCRFGLSVHNFIVLKLMHGHVSKHVKMQRTPTGDTNRHGKHIIARNGKEKGTHRATQHPEMHPK